MPHRLSEDFERRPKVSDLERIEENPDFKGTISELSFNEMMKVKPDIALLLKSLSIEEEARKWLVGEVVVLHNAMVKNQETLQDLVDQVRHISEAQGDDRRELAEYREVTKINDDQIRSWQRNFTAPARIFAGALVVIFTAFCGAVFAKFIK